MSNKMELIPINDLDVSFTENFSYNIFDCPAYLDFYSNHISSKCYYLKYSNSNRIFFFPLIKRFNGNSFDFFSSWYYNSILTPINQKGQHFNLDVFLSEFNNFCIDNEITSYFFRLNPYESFTSKTKLKVIGECVNINLKNDIKIIRSNYSQRVRRYIRKSENLGINIKINDMSYLSDFMQIYSNSMNIKSSRKFYFFSEEQINKLKLGLGTRFTLFTSHLNDEIISGSICLHDSNNSYYFLGARNHNFTKINVNYYLFDKMIEYYKNREKETLDLGGGHSSLLKFKKSFSKDSNLLLGIARVINKNDYNTLATKDGKHRKDLLYEKADYFPEYKYEI